jgi:hypothetical protein
MTICGEMTPAVDLVNQTFFRKSGVRDQPAVFPRRHSDFARPNDRKYRESKRPRLLRKYILAKILFSHKYRESKQALSRIK